MAQELTKQQRFQGAMTGSALGDAFGYPLQEINFDKICKRFEELGAVRLPVSKKTGTALFTDATQMSLFTADGIMWAKSQKKAYDNNACAGFIFYSYQLWLYTQTKTVAGKEYGWLFDPKQNANPSNLMKLKALTKNRRCLETNVTALLACRNDVFGRLSKPLNNNTDNTALKRTTPVGLFYAGDSEMAFRMACDFAAITHGHPDGYLPCGVYAAIVAELVNGATVDDAVEAAMKILSGYKYFEGTYNALAAALNFAEDDELELLTAVRQLGLGYEATEALAIAVLCAVVHQGNFKFAVELAANQDGDSATCAAVTGGILGAYYGIGDLPRDWTKRLQLKKLIDDSACALYDASGLVDDEEEVSDDEEIAEEDEEDSEYEDRSPRFRRK